MEVGKSGAGDYIRPVAALSTPAWNDSSCCKVKTGSDETPFMFHSTAEGLKVSQLQL